MISFTIPIKAVNVSNQREHHFARHRRVKAQREAVGWCWQTIPLAERLAIAGAVDGGGLLVKVVRVAPRELDPHDGLPCSLKPVVDQIAQQLSVDDKDKRIEWRYGQERGTKAKEYAVRVEIEPKSS